MENQLQTAEQSISERFTNSVLKDFGSHNGVIAATDYQKTLVQGYYIAIDRTLTATAAERIRKNESNKNHFNTNYSKLQTTRTDKIKEHISPPSSFNNIRRDSQGDKMGEIPSNPHWYKGGIWSPFTANIYKPVCL